MIENKYLRLAKRLFIFFTIFAALVIIIFLIFIFPRRTIPILMYHSITSDEQKNILTLSKNTFETQMQYLSNRGFYIARLEELAKKIEAGENIPKNWVVLTFDDGFKDFYSSAYPMLKRLEFKATVFVITNSLEISKNSLDWKDLENLAKDSSIDIGAHCLEHIPLPLLESSKARNEIFGSKRILEERLGREVKSLAYPYGAANDLLKKMVRDAGFRVAVGTAYQRGEFKDNDIYILKRVFVSRISQYPLVFKFMLSGYYVATREFILKVLNIKTPRDLYSQKEILNQLFIERRTIFTSFLKDISFSTILFFSSKI